MRLALVVEDEPRVADLCVRLLQRIGFEPRIVGTVREAMDVLGGAEPLDFAYIDVGLPDGSGLDVAAEARRGRPTMPIVVATGFLRDLGATDGIELHKPFTLAQFQSAVTDALRAVAPTEV
jgi:DNA-binding response OmpR family regulator